MQERGDSFLRHIEGLLKEGRHAEARPLLAAFIHRHPASARGWWLLSLLLTDEQQQVDCLERVLQLDPHSALAQMRLAKLRARLVAAAESEPAPQVAPVEASAARPSVSRPRPDVPPASIPVGRQSGPRRAPARTRKSSFLPLVVLISVFCVAMGVVGFMALAMLNRNAAPLQMPTRLVVVQTTFSTEGFELPATWTPSVTFTPLPSRTPLPSDTPLPPTPTLRYTFTHTPLPPHVIGPQKGLYAPDFALYNLSDAKVSLSDYAGRPVILLFWATWCPYCEREMGALQSVYEKYQGSGLSVLAVNCGDPAGQVRSYRNAHDLTFPILMDAKSKTLNLYRMSSFPSHFFIASDGRINFIAVGMLDSASLSLHAQTILIDTP